MESSFSKPGMSEVECSGTVIELPEDLIAELDRSRRVTKGAVLSSEQIEFCRYAREGDTCVPWGKMAEIFSARWYKIGESVLRDRYMRCKVGHR